MRKIKYQISKIGGVKEEVVGDLVSPSFGIHQREDRMYALTHIPTGHLVASSRLKKNLQLLSAEPEFFDFTDPTDPEQLKKLSTAVTRFFEAHSWK